MKKIAFLLLPILGGCAHPMVHLYEPTTKQVVECSPDPWGTWTPGADAEKCAQGFEKLGYKRVYDPN